MWELRAKFCPLCATPLASRRLEERDRLACPACTFVLYANPAAASAAVVLRGREVLLVRRALEPYRGHWTLPAGYEEYEESPEETAVRETQEESGVVVRVVGLYDVHYTFDDPRKRGVLMTFLCEPVGGVLAAGTDAFEARYFPVDALPVDVGFVNNRLILDRLRRELDAGGLRLVPRPGPHDPLPPP